MGQGSETQLQVCENLNYLIQRFKGNILLLLVTMNKFSTIFAVQNKFVGLLLPGICYILVHFFRIFFAFDFNGTYSLSLYRHLHHVQGRDFPLKIH